MTIAVTFAAENFNKVNGIAINDEGREATQVTYFYKVSDEEISLDILTLIDKAKAAAIAKGCDPKFYLGGYIKVG